MGNYYRICNKHLGICTVFRDMLLIIMGSMALVSFSATSSADELPPLPPADIEVPSEAILKKYDSGTKLEVKHIRI